MERDPSYGLRFTQGLLARQLGVSPEMLTPDLRVQEDLGLDSADAAELLIAVEEATGETMEVNSLADFATIGDIARRVDEQLAAATAAQA